MRNLREYCLLLVPGHHPIRYNPTKDNKLTQKIESTVYSLNNQKLLCLLSCSSPNVILDLFSDK